MPQSIIAVQTCWVWTCSFKTSLNKGFSSRSTFWTVLKSRSFFFCINELSNACISPVTSSHITTHNRITTDCHTTQDTHDTTHTHTNKPGRRLLSNAKRKTSGAQRIRVFRGKERAKPRLDATPNRRKKTLLYSKWLPAEKGHNSGKRLTCPAAQAKRLAIAGPQQTAGGSWRIQKKKKQT